MSALNMKNRTFFDLGKVKINHKNHQNGSVIYKQNPPFYNQFIFCIETIEKNVSKNA